MTDGAAIAENNTKSGRSKDLYIYSSQAVELGFHGGNPEYRISNSMLGGAPYLWKDNNNTQVLLNQLSGTLLGEGTHISLHTDQKINQATNELGKVLISGNKSATRGGGIGSNGVVIIGTADTTELKVTKAWDDNNNEANLRPNEIEIQLWRKIQSETDYVYIGSETMHPDESGAWELIFTNLPKQDPNGADYEYKVKEVPVPGYKTTISGNQNEGYSLFNTLAPETVAVEGTKTWNDNNNQDGKRPESITIRLLKNGVEIDSKTVTEADGWAWSFADLAKYEDGELITYTVTEDAVAEYSSEVSGYNVTNIHTPGKTSVQVTKAWADGNNQDGVRPESVTIKLLADGVDTGKTLVLTATSNWTGTFSDLDEYANGELIAYTVEEVVIGNGYVTVISGDQRTGYKVTNVRTPNPPDHPSTPTEPSEPKTPTTLPRTGESGSIYGWLGMFLLSLGLFLIMIKREFQLRKKHD